MRPKKHINYIHYTLSDNIIKWFQKYTHAHTLFYYENILFCHVKEISILIRLKANALFIVKKERQSLIWRHLHGNRNLIELHFPEGTARRPLHSYWVPKCCRHQRAVRRDAVRRTLVISAMCVASSPRRSVRCVRSPLSVGVWTQPSVHEKRGSGAVCVCARGAASLARLDRQNCAAAGLRLRR